MKTVTQKTVISSMFAALICVATMLINIPANAVQAIAGIIIDVLLITLFEKQNIIKILK